MDYFSRSLKYIFITIYSYLGISEENIAKKCPFYCNTCNCKSCLGMDTKLEVSFLVSTIYIFVNIFVIYLITEHNDYSKYYVED